MGVKELWPILEPVQRAATLTDLQGKVVAIDLSIWVREADVIHNVDRPYLRNLFFRVSHMLRSQVTPVFVVDGQAPLLKSAELERRAAAQCRLAGETSADRRPPYNSPRGKHSRFYQQINECLQLLDSLGVCHIQSDGEAEATCAQLNMHGVVDACVTQDGDAFLFGARAVYRNFTCTDKKDDQMSVVYMSDVEEKLGLTRKHLVGLALLLGCDYYAGVKSVGRKQAERLMQEIRGHDALQRFKEWRTDELYQTLSSYEGQPKPRHCMKCRHPGSSDVHSKQGCQWCKGDVGCEPHQANHPCPCEHHVNLRKVTERALEMRVRRHALEDTNFPPQEVIDAFLCPSYSPPKGHMDWQKPSIAQLKAFNERFLRWGADKQQERFTPLFTAWDLTHPEETSLLPLRILKICRQRGRRLIEIEWKFEDKSLQLKRLETVTTMECYDIMKDVHPDLVTGYEDEMEKARSKDRKIPAKRKLKEAAVASRSLKDMWSVKKTAVGDSGMRQGPRRRSLVMDEDDAKRPEAAVLTLPNGNKKDADSTTLAETPAGKGCSDKEDNIPKDTADTVYPIAGQAAVDMAESVSSDDENDFRELQIVTEDSDEEEDARTSAEKVCTQSSIGKRRGASKPPRRRAGTFTATNICDESSVASGPGELSKVSSSAEVSDRYGVTADEDTEDLKYSGGAIFRGGPQPTISNSNSQSESNSHNVSAVSCSADVGTPGKISGQEASCTIYSDSDTERAPQEDHVVRAIRLDSSQAPVADVEVQRGAATRGQKQLARQPRQRQTAAMTRRKAGGTGTKRTRWSRRVIQQTSTNPIDSNDSDEDITIVSSDTRAPRSTQVRDDLSNTEDAERSRWKKARVVLRKLGANDIPQCQVVPTAATHTSHVSTTTTSHTTSPCPTASSTSVPCSDQTIKVSLTASPVPTTASSDLSGSADNNNIPPHTATPDLIPTSSPYTPAVHTPTTSPTNKSAPVTSSAPATVLMCTTLPSSTIPTTTNSFTLGNRETSVQLANGDECGGYSLRNQRQPSRTRKRKSTIAHPPSGQPKITQMFRVKDQSSSNGLKMVLVRNNNCS